jgi:hypothetical protein
MLVVEAVGLEKTDYAVCYYSYYVKEGRYSILGSGSISSIINSFGIVVK